MPLPVGFAELVADQLVGGFLVGNAQQCLGHAHQQHALLAAEVVLTHEGLDRALVLGAGAHPAHQIGGSGLHLRLFGGGQAGLFKKFVDVAGLILQPRIGDGLTQRGRWRWKFGEKQWSSAVGRCCVHCAWPRLDSAILIVDGEFPSPFRYFIAAGKHCSMGDSRYF